VHGSAAEQLEYNVYEENKILKEKKKQRSNTKAKFKAVVFLAVVAAMFLAVVLRYAILTEHTYNIQMHNTELKEVINQNLKLSIEIENNMDLHKIREVAEKKLGMQKAKSLQHLIQMLLFHMMTYLIILYLQPKLLL